MTASKDIVRPPKAQVDVLREIGAAPVSSTLHHMGIRDVHMHGPVSWHKGKAIAGPALTLQFMPKREDLYGDGEYNDPESSCIAMCFTKCSRVMLWLSTQGRPPASSAR